MTASRPDDGRDGTAEVIENIATGNHPALAQALSWLERADPRAAELHRAFSTGPRPRHVVGITGAPGAGSRH